MPESHTKPLKNGFPWLWVLWIGGFLLWTAGLLVPIPSDPVEIEAYRIDLKLIIGKSLHFSVYAGLTFLSGLLRVNLRYRWLLMFFLMGHASLTEFLQSLGEDRSGQLTDVVLNHLGIAVGLLLSWRWWTAPETRL